MPLECFNRRTHLNVIVNSTSTYLIIDVGWGCMHIYLFFLFDMWLNSCLSIFFKSKQKINKGHSHNYYFVEFYRTGTCEMCIYRMKYTWLCQPLWMWEQQTILISLCIYRMSALDYIPWYFLWYRGKFIYLFIYFFFCFNILICVHIYIQRT